MLLPKHFQKFEDIRFPSKSRFNPIATSIVYNFELFLPVLNSGDGRQEIFLPWSNDMFPPLGRFSFCGFNGKKKVPFFLLPELYSIPPPPPRKKGLDFNTKHNQAGCL